MTSGARAVVAAGMTMMMTTRRTLLALLPLIFLTGCLTDPDIEDVVDAIAWELQPADLDTEVELRIGNGLIGVAEWICNISDDCEEWEEILSGVDQIHLGVYEVEGGRYSDGLQMTDELRDDLVYGDWKLVVSAYDRHDTAFVLANADEWGIHEILVISYDGDQVVVVRLEGELEKSLHHLIHREDGYMLAAHGDF